MISQKTEADRIEVIENLLGMALALADRLDPVLAAMISHSSVRIDELKANRSTGEAAHLAIAILSKQLRSER